MSLQRTPSLSSFPPQLRQGMLDQTEAARRRTHRLVADIARRDEQHLVFGERTLKEVRLDRERVAAAAETSSNPAAAESRLVDECGDNLYARAVLVRMRWQRL